uniref:Rhamnogalacturonase A/B/Epimerase-like pectate lyase domain-containing protein n=1 Tax=Schlesneria paludicola TaxID=360056 RepID=A0A7C4QNQ6_9PLAN
MVSHLLIRSLIVVMVLFTVSVLAFAGSIEFPDNSGYLNLRTRYGAKGDGQTDDTQAFQAAVKDNVRSLYLPKGTYLVSDSVVFGGKRWIIQGESRTETIIRLKDRASGFNDPTKPKPVISMFGPFMDPKANMGQAFRNSLFNLTIDVGHGNPGAVGLHYLNNNQGTVREVTVRSSDPERRGKAGLALVTNWPGPALFDRVRVEGFDLGIWSTISQYSLVFDRLELVGQREVGIENVNQTLSLRRLRSQNTVPAIRTSGSGAVIHVFDSELIGGDAKADAIVVTGGAAVVAFRLKTDGYGTAIRHSAGKEEKTVLGPTVSGFSTHPLLPTNATEPPAPLAQVEDAPITELPPLTEWADITTYGAKPVKDKVVEDAGPAIQKAIDSGKPVVYFPAGTYAIRTTVRVRGKVARLIGMESRIRGLTGTEPVWRIEDGDAPAVIFERFEGDYESTSSCYFEHACTRPLVLRQMMNSGYRNTVRGGTVFLDDVCGTNWEFTGQTVWARQLNPEAKGKADFNIRATDSRLWLLGVKTEGPKTVLTAKGGRSELWGGFFYASRGTDNGAAAIDLNDSDFVGGWVNHLGGSYQPQVRHRRGDQLEEFWLHVDFSDPSKLPLVRKRVWGSDVVEDVRVNQEEKSPGSIFRHGSYGVRLPWYNSRSNQ